MRTVVMLVALALVGGCGFEPGVTNIRETYPKVSVDYANTLLGKAMKLRCTSDFTGQAEGKVNPQTKEMEFKINVNSNVSGVLPAYAQVGQMYLLPSQGLDNEWHADLRRTIIQGLQIVAPLVSQYIGAWQSLGEARLMQPSLVTQAAGLLAAANSGNSAFSASALWSTFGPQLRAALQKIVPNAVPTTQPSL